MTESSKDYAIYFHAGLRVEIGIPLASEEIFREWAVVERFSDDLVVVQLSRDYLPRNIRIRYGDILDIGVWRNKEVYACKAIVIEEPQRRRVELRLIGAVTLKERRQFYRISVRLRINYAVPEEQTLHDVKTAWEERREAELLNRRQEGDDFSPLQLREGKLAAQQIIRDKLVWHENLAPLVSIGGGGVGIKLQRKVAPESYVDLEIFLPQVPVQIIHAVGEVAYVLEPLSEKAEAYYTGIKFLYLHEHDRDQIYQFISRTELQRLREMSDKLYNAKNPEEIGPVPLQSLNFATLLKRWVAFIIFLLTAYYLTQYFIGYKRLGGNNLIQKTYQEQINRYIEMKKPGRD